MSDNRLNSNQAQMMEHLRIASPSRPIKLSIIYGMRDTVNYRDYLGLEKDGYIIRTEEGEYPTDKGLEFLAQLELESS